MDHIRIGICGNDKIADIVEKNKTLMTEKLLADEIVREKSFANEKEWKVNDETVTISVEKA